MLNVLVLVNLSLVQALVKVGRIVVLVRDTDPNELCHRVGFSRGSGPGRGRSVACLDLQGVRAFRLPVEDHLGADLARLAVDLEVVFTLGFGVDVVVDLELLKNA